MFLHLLRNAYLSTISDIDSILFIFILGGQFNYLPFCSFNKIFDTCTLTPIMFKCYHERYDKFDTRTIISKNVLFQNKVFGSYQDFVDILSALPSLIIHDGLQV